MVAAPMLDPDRMQPGQTQAGPAILVAVDTTVVIPAGALATMTDGGYIIVEFVEIP
jgi:N-methylhydantoinase A/oxoprolinase/acetone carboxylase beta subunit